MQNWCGVLENPNLLFFFSFFFFFLAGVFSRTLTTHRTAGEGGDHFLFHSTTSTRSQPFRHLFATLNVRWVSHIFNRSACFYQTATRWDFPTLSNYHFIDITLSIDDVKFVLVCLLDDLILGFCYSNLDTGSRWSRTRIDYQPCITSEPTSQVC